MAWFGKKEKTPAAAPPTKAAPVSDAGAVEGRVKLPPLSRSLSGEERTLIVTCCGESTPAAVTWPQQGNIRQATFSRVDGDQLIMDLAGGADQEPYECRPRTQCVVSFFYRDRIGSFIGYEEPYAAGRSADRLALRMPTQLAIEGRTRFRIPILPKLGLVLHVVHDGRRVKVPEPVDISVAGIMLAFSTSTDPALQAAEVLPLSMELEGESFHVPISVRARIVRPTQVRYGCIFHNGANGYDYDQDRELSEMIMGIERYWARNRNR